MKPGESAEIDGILPMRLQNSRAVARVSGEVCNPVMTSTPFCTGTGFMKCVLITLLLADRSVGSLVVAAAMRVMLIEEVLVERMACGGQIWARLANILSFRSRISGTASMTMSTSWKSSMLEVVVRRARASSASDWLSFCLETSLARSLSMGVLDAGVVVW